jgi:hypothetical protein
MMLFRRRELCVLDYGFEAVTGLAFGDVRAHSIIGSHSSSKALLSVGT